MKLGAKNRAGYKEYLAGIRTNATLCTHASGLAQLEGHATDAVNGRDLYIVYCTATHYTLLLLEGLNNFYNL